MSTPRLSVVMPAYNAAPYIEDAVRSILTQTFTDFELLIIDDGSTDKTASILAEFSDKRIRVFAQENKGIVSSLNRAIDLSRAPIIARHDADDRSKPQRFAQQLQFLDSNAGVVLVGSSMSVMDMGGKYLHDHYVLTGNAELKQELLVRSPFAHGSVMFRKEAFEHAARYSQEDWPAEDYGLWLRMAKEGRFANIDTPLYIYRENKEGISMSNASEQIAKTARIRGLGWGLRRTLLSKEIDTESYVKLEMGQSRLERIAHNLLGTAKKSLLRGDVVSLFKVLLSILRDKILVRKCARFILIKIGLKK